METMLHQILNRTAPVLQVLHNHFKCYEDIVSTVRMLYLHVNPLTAGAACIRVFIFYYHIKYHLLNMLKIKCDIKQQDFKTVDLHFVKSK